MKRAIPPLPRLNALVLDFDGTLVDSEPLHTVAWGEAGKILGFPADTPWLHQVGVSDDVIAGMIRDRLRPDLTVKALLDGKNQAFQRLFPSLTPAPGALELLAWARSMGLRVAIASSGIRGYVPALADHLGFTPFVECFACGDEVARKKPAPDVFQLALTRLRLEAGVTATVEDSNAGVAAAGAAGIPCIALSHGISPETGEKADRVAADLFEALAILKGG